jgi:hypothetical protein
MGLPVLIVNPTDPPKKRKGRRMARRKMKWADLGMAMLGGVALGAGAYALDGTNLSKTVTGLIKVGAGALVGGGVSMAQPALGAGIAGAGAGLGAYDLGSEAVSALGGGKAAGNGNDTAAIRARGLRAVRKQLPGGQRSHKGFDVGAAAQAANNLRAIRAKLPA